MANNQLQNVLPINQAQGAAINTGTSSFIGGLIFGPLGVGIGGVLSALYNMAKTKGKFQGLIQLAEKMPRTEYLALLSFLISTYPYWREPAQRVLDMLKENGQLILERFRQQETREIQF